MSQVNRVHESKDHSELMAAFEGMVNPLHELSISRESMYLFETINRTLLSSKNEAILTSKQEFLEIVFAINSLWVFILALKGWQSVSLKFKGHIIPWLTLILSVFNL